MNYSLTIDSEEKAVAVMDILVIILGITISYTILYFVIKAAVRNGIIEARNMNSVSDNIADNDNRIAQKACPNCKIEHDCDYPKCPYCEYQYYNK